MPNQVGTSQVIRFATFEVDLQAQELRKGGLRLKLSGQPFQVLAILLEQPGVVVTREELQKRLWPDTFVDVDHNLNTAINKIREMLGDSAENPRFVETLPRRGYRFIAPVEDNLHAQPSGPSGVGTQLPQRTWTLRLALFFGACVLLAGAGLFLYRRQHAPASPERTLTRVTFDDGLQIGATWSPDGRFIAYTSDRGGKFDVWVQQVSGGDPVQITRGPGPNWQPDWSPDGKFIAYRSEAGGGGLFVVPALGGEGLQRRVTSFGYYPHWSPDGQQILFQTSTLRNTGCKFYLVGLEGNTPREVLAELTTRMVTRSAAWHPDGKRVSVWVFHDIDSPVPDIWTVPVGGGVPVRSEIDPAISKRAESVAGGGRSPWGDSDFRFSWAPTGKAIYFERSFRGARNIWRMNIDPQTLRGIGIERLTTGPGLDTEFSLSPSGEKLAFTGQTQLVKAWMFPFDATHGQVTGPGGALTSTGKEAWGASLSRDGKKFVFSGKRAGRWELWEKSLVDGREAPIFTDDAYFRDEGLWSPDGARLAYERSKTATGEIQVAIWSSESRTEEPLTESSNRYDYTNDWSPDGEWLLVSRENKETGNPEIWKIPVAGVLAKREPQKIISDPGFNLWQGRFSPDGRWIVFEAVRDQDTRIESTIYVVAVDGGQWVRITDGKHWDDKPRWSPDGRVIYFLSERSGLFNVWGVHFDPGKGSPVGEPVPVTALDNPNLMVPKSIEQVGLALTQGRLVVTVTQASGSIWVLENVDR
jgi:Tol biopolymer transport system component/DNA-binding winged helix-turn-helix (wHTH) protein